MQESSSITTMPPEPIIAPACLSESKSIGVSRKLSGRQPPEGPPICTALKAFLLGIPPHTSKMSVRRLVPMAISTSPGCLTFPTTEKTAVPGLLAVPMARNHDPPFWTIEGKDDSVLTLFTTVGRPHKPFSTG